MQTVPFVVLVSAFEPASRTNSLNWVSYFKLPLIIFTLNTVCHISQKKVSFKKIKYKNSSRGILHATQISKLRLVEKRKKIDIFRKISPKLSTPKSSASNQKSKAEKIVEGYFWIFFFKKQLFLRYFFCRRRFWIFFHLF